MSMNNLANAFAALRQAAALHMEVPALRKRVMGADHPDIAIYEHKQLGQHLCCAESLQVGCGASWALHGEDLALYKRMMGADHPPTLP